MSEALYRKYRPQIFEDVVGQEHIERTLKNAIEQDKVSHAYLFCGPRGTGKTTTARLLAKALLCEKGPTPEPDGTCEDCQMIADGEHPDVNELDAASRTGVENVREEIIGRVQFAPTRGRYKVYIIDEVHMLSTAAFNALLKTLEEPPGHVVFILCTTDPQKVPETIHSRCQRFDFRRISNEALVSRLGAVCVAEGVEFEGEALDLIAHRAEGGMRNALTSLEQVIAFSEGAVTLEHAERLLGSLDSSELSEIVDAIGKRDVAACFRWTANFVETGADLAHFVRDLAERVRNLYVMTLAGADVALEVSASERRELEAELPLFAPDRLARLLDVLGNLTNELKTATNPRLSFEIALTRMVRPDSDLTLQSLAERIEALESGYSAVAHVTAVPQAAAQPAAAAQTQPVVRAQQAAQTQQVAAQTQPTTYAQAPAATQAQPAVVQSQQVATQAQPSGTQSQQAVRSQRGAAEYSAASAASSEYSAAQHASGMGASAGAATGSSAASAGPAGVSDRLMASLSNPAALQRLWQGALSTLKKEKAAYGVLFLNTKAVFDAAQSALAIEFPVENTFAFKAVQKPDVQDAVASALQRACGESLNFFYVQGAQRVAVRGELSVAHSMASQASAAQASAQPAAAQAGVQPVAAQASTQPAAVETESRSSATQVAAGAASFGNAVSHEPAASQGGGAQPYSAPRQYIDEAPQSDPVPYGDAVPYDEPVPYDDDMVPYSEPVPYDEPASYGDPVPYREPAPVPHNEPAPASYGEPAAPFATAAASAPASTASDAMTADDLQAILAAGFGDGVRIEEVRE